MATEKTMRSEEVAPPILKPDYNLSQLVAAKKNAVDSAKMAQTNAEKTILATVDLLKYSIKKSEPLGRLFLEEVKG